MRFKTCQNRSSKITAHQDCLSEEGARRGRELVCPDCIGIGDPKDLENTRSKGVGR